MDLDAIREALFTNMDNQLAVDKETNETNQRLGQQKIMYANDARGTLYSGQPTWERANLAAQGIQNLANLENSYMKQKLDVWNNITKTLDQINSYNKAAAAITQASNNNNAQQTYLELYNSLQGGQG